LKIHKEEDNIVDVDMIKKTEVRIESPEGKRKLKSGWKRLRLKKRHIW